MLKLYIVRVLLVTILMGASLVVAAQESTTTHQGEATVEEELKDPDKSVVKEETGESVKTKEEILPTVVPAPVGGSMAKNKGKNKEDDSVLSFNFLSYIFQRFKLQDITD